MLKKTILFILLIQSSIMGAQEKDPWTVYMTPSSIHESFAKYEGEFQMEIEMNGLNEPMVISSSHAMILGGRFLELKQKGKMMGMDYESIFTIGHNTIDGSISMTTLTNMGTGTLALNGEWDENTNTATLYGKLTNPVSKKTINVKQTLEFIDEDTFLIQSFDQEEDQPEKKTVEYRFVRI
ncbi:DUF1579 family protein [Flagellimonas amoyensis]|uniref:DUF1579 family protein n=1 Tax=Flagellimonas amoyensis TaxID=2169401 RepID=UPI000D39F7F5|nr:DUF1579 family protein [Allomuricauda amoyensis]